MATVPGVVVLCFSWIGTGTRTRFTSVMMVLSLLRGAVVETKKKNRDTADFDRKL